MNGMTALGEKASMAQSLSGRRLLCLTTAITVILASGCQPLGIYTQGDIDEQQSEIDEKDERIAELEAKLQLANEHADELESRLEDLQSASDDLQSNVQRLQYENWRDVVPDIEDASDTVASFQTDAASAAEDLSSTLDQ
ncbi:hypothetical protein MNR01_02360 [Lysobacter sp. S4-A87]|uniref:hypothetical protein n=1 Tax=Lysobacter sp. S4-A87 TaxID=2925843 RepID=UPI001F5371AA|nr:hypothetical protein [Lysobacter sp. S4-A87]UNK49901.1 hypothetical protein MNR01_02360 [Lysobacter sp. S4-A87]